MFCFVFSLPRIDLVSDTLGFQRYIKPMMSSSTMFLHLKEVWFEVEFISCLISVRIQLEIS